MLAIPLYGVNNSLPVAIAAGITLSWWGHLRYAPGTVVVPRAPGLNAVEHIHRPLVARLVVAAARVFVPEARERVARQRLGGADLDDLQAPPPEGTQDGAALLVGQVDQLFFALEGVEAVVDAAGQLQVPVQPLVNQDIDQVPQQTEAPSEVGGGGWGGWGLTTITRSMVASSMAHARWARC